MTSREKKLQQKRDYYKRNREKILLYSKEYYEKNKEKIKSRRKEYFKKYYKKNKIKNNESSRKWREENKEYKKIKDREYYLENKDKIRERKKNWYKKNKDKLNKQRREWENKKIKEDPLFCLRRLLSTRTRNAFNQKSIKKNSKTEEIIGCDWETLRKHMESKFQNGMSWINRGKNGWHIDHIIPLSSAKTEDELKELCHYTNLQPLWEKDNLKKSNKII